MKKFSSILPANARIMTVDLSASPSRRPGSFDPFTGQIVKQNLPKLKTPEPVKLDKIEISPEAKKLQGEEVQYEDTRLQTDAISSEAKQLQDDDKDSALMDNHTKFQGYA